MRGTFFLLLLLVFASSKAILPKSYYSSRNDLKQFVRFSADGQSQTFLPVMYNGFVSELAWHKGRLYCIIAVGAGTAADPRFLGWVDLNTGDIRDSVGVSYNGSSYVVESLASDGNNLFIGFGVANPGTSLLWGTIDPLTGVVSLVGNTTYDNDGATFGDGQFWTCDAAVTANTSNLFKGTPTPNTFLGGMVQPQRGTADLSFLDGHLYCLDFNNSVDELSQIDGSILSSIPILNPGTLRGFETYPGPAITINPVLVTIKLGRLNSGSVADLNAVDNLGLIMCKFFVPNQQVAPVEVEVEGVSTYFSVNEITFNSASKMLAGGQFSQTIDMFDFQLGAFSPIDFRTDTLTTALSLVSLDATGGVSRYVGPNGSLKARYRVRQTGISASLNWCTLQDLATWSIR